MISALPPVSTDSREAIANGSKSFFLASLFFPQKTKEACWSLYQWCRHCDDVIDHGGGESELENLRVETLKAIDQKTASPVFSNLGEICREYQIPRAYPMELLNGFEADVKGIHIENLKQLEDYAFQVAGVVGLMMSHVMGAKFSQAEEPATALGNAMQLTNVSRDVHEDFLLGRIYLPMTWLNERNIDTDNLFVQEQRDRLFSVVERVLDRADQLYREGYRGLSYLPFRAAIAVSIAGSIYSAIGRKVRAGGPEGLTRRFYVTLPEKLWLALTGISRVLVQLPNRFAQRRLRANA